MISAVIGGVIMSAATVAMLLALNFTDNLMKNVGKEPLREKERNILINAGFDFSDIGLKESVLPFLPLEESNLELA